MGERTLADRARSSKRVNFGRLRGACYHFRVTDRRAPEPAAAPPGPLLPPRRAADEGAEACLLRALEAKSADERERHATLGLAALARLDEEEDDLEVLLLKQLYSAHMDRGRYGDALEVAEDMIDLGELGDIARQDAARAALGLGDEEVAAGHLKIAARICPPERRAFHFGTLGALYRFGGRGAEAAAAFRKASRWAREDRVLYSAQLALAEADLGQVNAPELAELRANLAEMAPLKGYALWVLGELSELLGDHPAGKEYMARFLQRLDGAPPAKCLALHGEIARAKAVLAEAS